MSTLALVVDVLLSSPHGPLASSAHHLLSGVVAPTALPPTAVPTVVPPTLIPTAVPTVIPPTAVPTPPPTPTPYPKMDCGVLEFSIPGPFGGNICVSVYDIVGSLLRSFALICAQATDLVLGAVMSIVTLSFDFTSGGLWQPLDDLFVSLYVIAWILLPAAVLLHVAYAIGAHPLRLGWALVHQVGGAVAKTIIFLGLLWPCMQLVFGLIGAFVQTVSGAGSAQLTGDIQRAITSQDQTPATVMIAFLDVGFGLAFIVVALLVGKERLLALGMLALLFVLAPLAILCLLLPPPFSKVGPLWAELMGVYLAYPVVILLMMKVDLILFYALPAQAPFVNLLLMRLLALVCLLILLRGLHLLHQLVGGMHPGEMHLPDVGKMARRVVGI